MSSNTRKGLVPKTKRIYTGEPYGCRCNLTEKESPFVPLNKIKKPSKEVLDFLRRTPTVYLSDSITRADLKGVKMRGVMPFIPFEDPHKHVAGPAVTIRFGPTLYKERYIEVPYHLTEIVESSPPGTVVVVEGFGQGEMNCKTGIRAGHEAFVADYPPRDVDPLKELARKLPLFNPPGVHTDSYVGDLEVICYNVPIVCNGATVRPGDIVVGDNNGVLVIPPQFVDKVIEGAKDIVKLEAQMADWIEKGKSWKEIYPLVHKRKYIKKT